MAAVESKPGQETSEDEGKVRGRARWRELNLRDSSGIRELSELETYGRESHGKL